MSDTKESKNEIGIIILIAGVLICVAIILNISALDIVYVGGGNIDANITSGLSVSASTNITAPLDASTEALITIEYEHHEVHDGTHYYSCNFITLNDEEEREFGFDTPTNNAEAHMTFSIDGTSQTELYIYEDANFTGGVITEIFNNNRNSNKTSNSSIYINPLITIVGDLIMVESSGLAGANPSKASLTSLVNRERELILELNESYVFKMVSRQDANIVSYCAEWYEHTPKG